MMVCIGSQSTVALLATTAIGACWSRSSCNAGRVRQKVREETTRATAEIQVFGSLTSACEVSATFIGKMNSSG
jgi:hypothetical protein